MVLMLMICMSDGISGCEMTALVGGIEVELGVAVAVIEIASTDSATASSSGEGSKKMFVPTDIKSNVIGGADIAGAAWWGGSSLAVTGALPFAFELLDVEVAVAVGLRREDEYRGREASQSSLNKGSSSPIDTSAGSWVSSSARCRDSERRGSGRLVGGDNSRI